MVPLSSLQAPVGEVFDRSTEGSVERNLQPIKEALAPFFSRPLTTSVLELASGFGQHICSWAPAHPDVRFQPTDRDPEGLAVIQQRRLSEQLSNILEPARLDVLDDQAWSNLPKHDVVVCINLIHVSPWAVTESLFRHVNEVLDEQHGLLILYGAYKIEGQFSAESDQAFDASLRTRDARFGLRDMETIEGLASECGLRLGERHALPSNNWLLVFQRSGK